MSLGAAALPLQLAQALEEAWSAATALAERLEGANGPRPDGPLPRLSADCLRLARRVAPETYAESQEEAQALLQKCRVPAVAAGAARLRLRGELTAMKTALGRLVGALDGLQTRQELQVGGPHPLKEDTPRCLEALRQAIRRATPGYVRSTPFLRLPLDDECHEAPVELDVRDLLLLGALAHTDVLLAGKTGSGKTKLATHVLTALFGVQGYHSHTVLPSMNADDFADINFARMKAGKLSSATEAPGLRKAALLINEANRAPAVVLSLLIPLLDRDFRRNGVSLPVGVAHGDDRYHYRILTINEGEEYAIFPLDPAVRDRAVLQIDLDMLPQPEPDVVEMLRRRQARASTEPGGTTPPPGDSAPQPIPGASAPTQGPEGSSAADPATGTEAADPDAWQAAPDCRLREVLALHDELLVIPLSAEAMGFLVYLSGLSNCPRSLTGSKEGMLFRPLTFCEGCHQASVLGGVCGVLRAPSQRALLKLQRVAQGVALFRACRRGQSEVCVTLEDLRAAAPFVLRGKLHLTPQWLQQDQKLVPGRGAGRLLGCEGKALSEILRELSQRYLRFRGSGLYGAFARYLERQPLTPEQVEVLARYSATQDVWAVNEVQLRDGLAAIPETAS